MKKSGKVASFLVIVGLLLTPISSSLADGWEYWPEYGTTAEHNQWAVKEINSLSANQNGITGAGIKVAVLDSGVAANTPGLSSKIIAYKDFVSALPPLEEHGTMTASSVASDLDLATGVSGSAPGASLIIGRVCYLMWCDDEAIRNGFNWAVDQGAQVISMSFGGGDDRYMNAAILTATKKGVVVVAALGNSGCTTYGNWGGINRSCVQGKILESYPSAYPIAGLISAGASDRSGARAGFSSWGPNLDLMAPGVDVAAFDPVGATNGFGGTSSATPLIAGVAALILSIKPDLTPSEVQGILQSTAKRAKETKPKVWDACTKSTVDGTWSCNAEVENDFPQEYFTGAGIVDAVAALELTRLINAGVTLEAPTATSTLENISVSWTDGPADLYVNSKLVAKNVTQYETQGKYSQSFAFQIRRETQISKPLLFILKPDLTPSAPEVVYFHAREEVIMITTGDLRLDQSQLSKSRHTAAAGLFEFDDGRVLVCTGHDQGAWSEDIVSNYYFTCPSATSITNLSGTFRLVNLYSRVSPPSRQLSAAVWPGIKKLPVTTSHLASGLIRFSWESVEGAQSYEYRKQDQTLECLSGTSVEISGVDQLGWFYVRALSEADCKGNMIIDSEYNLAYRLLVPTPPKPTGITVKEVNYIYTEFEGVVVEPKTYWRIYRSDGLMVRMYPGQRILVGMQPNEDVNGLTFSYRFMRISLGTWGEVWSELSDPVIVKTKDLSAPDGICQYGTQRHSVNCSVNPNQQSEGTLVEYLDADLQVIGSATSKNSESSGWSSKLRVNGASYVRVSATIGAAPYWYRRGEGRLIKIENQGFGSFRTFAR